LRACQSGCARRLHDANKATMPVLIGMHRAATVQARCKPLGCRRVHAQTCRRARQRLSHTRALCCSRKPQVLRAAGRADRLGSRAWQGRGHQVHDPGGGDVGHAEVCADQEDLAARLRVPLLRARHDAPSRWASTPLHSARARARVSWCSAEELTGGCAAP